MVRRVRESIASVRRAAVVCAALAAAPVGASQAVVELTPRGLSPDDAFGGTVALSGDLAVVGAAGLGDGTLFVFRDGPEGPLVEQVITAPPGFAGEGFPGALATDGLRIAAGVPFHDVDATADGGGVIVFRHDGGSWVVEDVVLSPVVEPQGQFGWSVAIDGDRLLVGSPFTDFIPGAFDSGRVDLFRRVRSSWVHAETFVDPVPSTGDLFGHSVDLAPGLLAIGAMETLRPGGGSVRVYREEGGGWTLEQRLESRSAGPGTQFGFDVDLDDDAVLAGLHGAASGAGAAILFRDTGPTGWVEEQVVGGHGTSADAWFGFAVGLSGDVAVAGVVFDDAGGPLSGSARAFRRVGAAWQEQNLLLPTPPTAGVTLGADVAVDGSVVLAGSDGGRAFVFDLGLQPWTDQGGALPGGAGAPRLAGTGSLAPLSSGALALTDVASAAAGLLFLSPSVRPVPFFGGVLQANPAVATRPVHTGRGAWSLPFTMPHDTPAGVELWLQAAVVDPAAPGGVAISNLLRALTP